MNKLLGLLFLLITTSALADSVTFHLIRSPKGINWASPWTMTVSAIKNTLAKTGDKRAFSISHVFVELKCDSTGTHILRGQTSIENSGERDLILKKKYGLGVLFQNYEGLFEKDERILKDLASYEGSKRVGKFTAMINPSTCARMLKFVNEYEERGYWKTYAGFHAEPLKGEGAGCSAFAMSFLRVGGLMESFTNEWQHILAVPKRFVGGPRTGNKVSILKLLAKPKASWSSSEPHFMMQAWDPEKMLKWVNKTHDLLQNGGELEDYETSFESVGNSKEVTVDLTDRPTPTGNIWLI